MAAKPGPRRPRPNNGRRQAMEAVSRIYMAGVMSGIRSWMDGSQLMADTAWEYYRQYMDGVDAAMDQKSGTGTAEWKARMQENIRTYMRNLENLQIQYQADFERRAFTIIDTVFDAEQPSNPGGAKATE